jgi:hypothetical protein
MLILANTTIPTLVMLFTIIISHSTIGNYVETCMNVILVIVLFPLFSYLLYTIWKMIKSFLQSFWSNVMKMLDIKSLTRRLFDPSTKLWYMILQLALFAAFYLVTFGIIITNLFSTKNTALTWLLAVDIIWALYGFAKVVIHSWRVLIFPSFKLLNNSSTSASEGEQSNSKWLRIILPIDILDPANLRNQDEWIEFLNDPACNEFHPSKKMSLTRIPGYVSGVLDAAIIAFLIFQFYIDSSRKFSYIFLPLICFLCFPMTVIFPITVPFYRRSKFNKDGSMKLIFSAMSVFYIALVVVVIAFWITIPIFAKRTLPEINYQYKENSTTAVLEHRPHFCTIKFGEYDLIQLSALNVLSVYTDKKSNGQCRPREGYEKSYLEILKYIFGETVAGSFSHICFDSILGTSIFYFKDSLNEKTQFIIARPIYDSASYGALLELVIQNYIPTIIKSIIPLYSFAIAVINDFMNKLVVITQNVFTAIPIVDGISIRVYNNIVNQKSKEGYMVGHSIGAYLLKQVSLFAQYDGLIFGSLPLYQTAESIEGTEERSQQTISANLIHLYSPESFIQYFEPKLKINIEIPKPKSALYSVFNDVCAVAALCSTNDKWLPFCEQLLFNNKTRSDEYIEIRDKAKDFVK